MTRRFYAAKQPAQVSPGRSIQLGIALSATLESAPAPSTPDDEADVCAPKLTWIDGTTGDKLFDGLPALIVQNSTDEWAWSFAGINIFTGLPIAGDVNIVDQFGPYLSFYVDSSNTVVTITANHAGVTVGPIVYTLPVGG